MKNLHTIQMPGKPLDTYKMCSVVEGVRQYGAENIRIRTTTGGGQVHVERRRQAREVWWHNDQQWTVVWPGEWWNMNSRERRALAARYTEGMVPRVKGTIMNAQ